MIRPVDPQLLLEPGTARRQQRGDEQTAGQAEEQ
jgi:hypothetical protein